MKNVNRIDAERMRIVIQACSVTCVNPVPIKQNRHCETAMRRNDRRYKLSSHQVFYALAAKTTTLAMALGSFFVPTLIGNIIGAVDLVAALNYAQISLVE